MNLNFASDNAGPAHPEVMAALVAANAGASMPYGADDGTASARDAMRALLGWPDAAVLLVATGTGANALALSGLVKPYQTILCHRDAHVQADECGAVEAATGGSKLTLVDGEGGRMTPEGLEARLAGMGLRGVHGQAKGALSLTNLTEWGTLYAPADVAALAEVARAHGMPVHLDGARFANAVAAAGCSAAEMAAPLDALVFGGTKNGCLGVEAVVMRDPARAEEMEYRRMRAGQLWSKHRFLAAQFGAYLADDLWLRNARAANAAGARLWNGLRGLGAAFVHEPAANMCFVRLDRAAHERALAEAAYYRMDDAERPLCRLVCDWTKTEAEVDRLLELVAG